MLTGCFRCSLLYFYPNRKFPRLHHRSVNLALRGPAANQDDDSTSMCHASPSACTHGGGGDSNCNFKVH